MPVNVGQPVLLWLIWVSLAAYTVWAVVQDHSVRTLVALFVAWSGGVLSLLLWQHHRRT